MELQRYDWDESGMIPHSQGDYVLYDDVKNPNPLFVEKFRCPLCGDSQRNPKAMRGYVFMFNGRKWYRCFNTYPDGCVANEAIPYEKFLELTQG